jgi:hypothetical protein
MPQAQNASSRVVWIGVLLAGTYVLFLAAILLVSLRSVVRPIFLEARDVLLGTEEPVEPGVRALDGTTGRPVEGVPLGFRACRDSREIARRSAVTDSSGVAAASFPPAAKWEEPRQAGGDLECLISIEDSSRFILDSPWREPGGSARHALLDILVIERGTNFLLVCLDGIFRDAGFKKGSESRVDGPWLHSPPREFLENVKARSRLLDRTVYLAPGEASSTQKLKFWLVNSGFPAGLLFHRDGGKPREDWLRELSSRLEGLGAKVGGIVCHREEKGVLQEAFPSASVEVVLPEFPR